MSLRMLERKAGNPASGSKGGGGGGKTGSYLSIESHGASLGCSMPFKSLWTNLVPSSSMAPSGLGAKKKLSGLIFLTNPKAGFNSKRR